MVVQQNKSCSDILKSVVATQDEMVMIQELVYDVRTDREFDYIKAAKHYGILDSIIFPVSSGMEAGYIIYAPYIFH